MRIRASGRFDHVGNLPNVLVSRDPRDRLAESEVVVDLRECESVRPAAVLWCAVYLGLAKSAGIESTLLVPENMGVATYLKSVGIFDQLKIRRVEIDDRGIPHRTDPQIVIPLTNFHTQTDVDRITNEAFDALRASGLGAGDLHPVVSEGFGELAMNAVQHAESSIGAYGFIQFYEFAEGRRFICCVADGGIGIRRSLKRNLALRDRVPYDWTAIELAIRERVSGSGDPHRGIGLFGVAEDMRKPGRRLTIHSGIGALEIKENLEMRSWRSSLFPGTLAFVSIPT